MKAKNNWFLEMISTCCTWCPSKRILILLKESSFFSCFISRGLVLECAWPLPLQHCTYKNKVKVFWEGHTILTKNVKATGTFVKCLWPSQLTWTDFLNIRKCIKLKVSKFQRQIFMFSFEPKTEHNYFLISALRI